MKRAFVFALLAFVLGGAVLLIYSEAMADIRQPVTIFNSRGRPWLNQTVIAKLHTDSTAVDTAYEVGGGLYYFQVDPDSGFTTRVCDIWRGSVLLTGFTAIKLGSESIVASIDSTEIDTLGIAGWNLAADCVDSGKVGADAIDSTHVRDGTLCASDLNTLRSCVTFAPDTTGNGGWPAFHVGGLLFQAVPENAGKGAAVGGTSFLRFNFQQDNINPAYQAGLLMAMGNVTDPDTTGIGIYLMGVNENMRLMHINNWEGKGLHVESIMDPSGDASIQGYGMLIENSVQGGTDFPNLVARADSSHKQAFHVSTGQTYLGDSVADTVHVGGLIRYVACGVDSVRRTGGVDACTVVCAAIDSSCVPIVTPLHNRAEPLYAGEITAGVGFAVRAIVTVAPLDDGLYRRFSWVVLKPE